MKQVTYVIPFDLSIHQFSHLRQLVEGMKRSFRLNLRTTNEIWPTSTSSELLWEEKKFLLSFNFIEVSNQKLATEAFQFIHYLINFHQEYELGRLTSWIQTKDSDGNSVRYGRDRSTGFIEMKVNGKVQTR